MPAAGLAAAFGHSSAAAAGGTDRSRGAPAAWGVLGCGKIAADFATALRLAGVLAPPAKLAPPISGLFFNFSICRFG